MKRKSRGFSASHLPDRRGNSCWRVRIVRPIPSLLPDPNNLAFLRESFAVEMRKGVRSAQKDVNFIVPAWFRCGRRSSGLSLRGAWRDCTPVSLGICGVSFVSAICSGPPCMGGWSCPSMAAEGLHPGSVCFGRVVLDAGGRQRARMEPLSDSGGIRGSSPPLAGSGMVEVYGWEAAGRLSRPSHPCHPGRLLISVLAVCAITCCGGGWCGGLHLRPPWPQRPYTLGRPCLDGAWRWGGEVLVCLPPPSLGDIVLEQCRSAALWPGRSVAG